MEITITINKLIEKNIKKIIKEGSFFGKEITVDSVVEKALEESCYSMANPVSPIAFVTKNMSSIKKVKESVLKMVIDNLSNPQRLKGWFVHSHKNPTSDLGVRTSFCDVIGRSSADLRHGSFWFNLNTHQLWYFYDPHRLPTAFYEYKKWIEIKRLNNVKEFKKAHKDLFSNPTVHITCDFSPENKKTHLVNWKQVSFKHGDIILGEYNQVKYRVKSEHENEYEFVRMPLLVKWQ